MIKRIDVVVHVVQRIKMPRKMHKPKLAALILLLLALS
jgi:hypothetical protein